MSLDVGVLSEAPVVLPPVLSVTALNRLVRERLERGFPLCTVSGEVSNLTLATSGHAYFTLKDATAQVRCVMFRHRHHLLGWQLTNGQQVELRAWVSFYEPRGDFQLNVDSMQRAGLGSLYAQFEQLKTKLTVEGLFAPEKKRPLPLFPRTLGIVTSPQAAALRDVLITLQRRAPHVSVVLFPCLVQGELAAAQIAAALAEAGASGLCEVVLLCRGGGSIEDLWAFNEEVVARAIRACPVPVICGVGHETDFTIADFAADRRAPTPTAAAEMAAPVRDQWRDRLNGFRVVMLRQLRQKIASQAQGLDGLAHRLVHPSARLQQQRIYLGRLDQDLRASLWRMLAQCRTRLALCETIWRQLAPDVSRMRHEWKSHSLNMNKAWHQYCLKRHSHLKHCRDSLGYLDPRSVLDRGYALVRDASGQIVYEASAVELKSTLQVYLARGRMDVEVLTVDGSDQGSIG